MEYFASNGVATNASEIYPKGLVMTPDSVLPNNLTAVTSSSAKLSNDNHCIRFAAEKN
jgi:hypothetical protein